MAKNDLKLAKEWGCSARTIQVWRRAGAPLESKAKMRAWLTSRKNIPAGTARLLHKTRKRETATAAIEEHELPEGAASALSRLEEAEATAFRDFKAATESGDGVTIK